MSFEQVAVAADAIVLGTVIERPAKARFDQKKKHAYRHNRVAVERYLKGDGAAEIIVKTYGGDIEVDIPGQPRDQFISYLGTPQLPEAGAKVLLFLRRSGRDTYKIYSATHGVLPVTTREDGAELVGLRIKDPRVMPSRSRANYEELKKEGWTPKQGVSDTVLTRDLDLLLRIALDPDEPDAAPRVQSFDARATSK